MLTLTQAEEGQHYTIKEINGNTRFISRITSVGLTSGGTLEVIRNNKSLPLLIYSRDTMLAVNFNEAANIYVEVNEK